MFAKRKDVKIALPGLQSFSCCNGQLWYFTEEDGVYFLHLDGQDVRIAIAKQHNQIAHTDSGLLVVIFSDNTYAIYDRLSLDMIKDGTESSVKITLNHLSGNHFGSIFFAYTGSFPNQERGWFDISNDAVQCMSKDLFPWYFAGKEIIGKKNNSRTTCLYRDCNELWHFDVSEPGRYREWYPEGPEHPGEVRKFLGVWEGMLLVALSGYTIVALDVETGRVLHKWRDIPGFEPGWMPSAIPKPERMVLDAAGGKLVALWSRYFWEIDLRSGDIQMHDLSADFGTPRDLVRYLVQGGSNPALLGDKHLIAFAERYHSERDGYDAEIIAFNRQTRQIDWRHTFPLGAGVQFGVNNPVIAGNRLYALDISGTLHIFERTE